MVARFRGNAARIGCRVSGEATRPRLRTRAVPKDSRGDTLRLIGPQFTGLRATEDATSSALAAQGANYPQMRYSIPPKPNDLIPKLHPAEWQIEVSRHD